MTLKNKFACLLTTAGMFFLPEAGLEANAQNNRPVLEQIAEEPSSLSKDSEFNALLIQNAKKYLGREYLWGGRNTKKNPGIDCMGLIFLAYSQTTGKPWYDLSVNPSELVKNGKLGRPVKGLDGVLRKDIDYSKFKKGDVLYFLLKDFVIEEKPLAKINGDSYWPWHMGLYESEKKYSVLHADPGDEVKSQPMEGINFEALFVTRLK